MNHHQNYDVIIIGGGFAGCALAYQFSKTKSKTLLLEKSFIGSGSSTTCSGRVQIFDAESEALIVLEQT